MRLDPRQPYLELMTIVVFAAAAWLACVTAIAAGPAESQLKEDKLEPIGSYEVKDGDSLSEIALAHGVTIEHLMQANELEDPDKIFVGAKPCCGNSRGGTGSASAARAPVSTRHAATVANK